VVNPIIACPSGAVYAQYNPPIIPRREVHVLLPNSPGVIENHVSTDHDGHPHVMRWKYVPKSPSAAETIKGDEARITITEYVTPRKSVVFIIVKKLIYPYRVTLNRKKSKNQDKKSKNPLQKSAKDF